MALKKDARRISYLIRRNTIEVQENNYTKAQKDAWIKANSPSQVLKQMNDRQIFCAFSKNKLVGTIALAENEILGFYVGYTTRGKGVGKLLYHYIEDLARDQGITILKLTSTPAGIPFYLHLSFQKKKPVMVTINNLDFYEELMTKQLK